MSQKRKEGDSPAIAGFIGFEPFSLIGEALPGDDSGWEN